MTTSTSALHRARAAAPGWAATPPAERGRLLHVAAQAVREQADELAACQEAETGRPRDDAREGVLAGAGTLDQYAELGPVHRGRALQGGDSATDLMIPRPRGVVVAITPWNDPVAIACGLIGAALATGNVVVHKPSERAPKVGELLGQAIAGAIERTDVVATVSGDGAVGAELAGAEEVDLVAHVGSTRAGRSIAAAAAVTGAKVLLENGGNDPLLIDDDVDPGWAAEQAALGSFANSGQICVSVERILVHRRIAVPFIEALTEQARRRGNLPLVDRAHRDGVHAHVSAAVAAGAVCHIGGEVPDGEGASYPATVLSGCTPEMAAYAEETFGPVAAVRAVDDFDQALLEAAAGPHGLGAGVLTRSMEHAQRAWSRLPVGTVKVNDVFGGAPGGAAEPRGCSGQGFGFGPELLDEMSTVKVLHLAPPPDGAW
ncbi:aldehyde dehydrogenase [Pseudonocardia sp. KRD291]|uniref:aldehyde dehydrogenase family protein n=1 Tax=Pseudonocardia sp. KRD291 TaxID=2792007 RepID=UPI001C4A4407|nr:aldehyde dehydrogenase family protein [Pseudonocardia sp. KRD291]MBW0101310.1 aldehyde dehydrogenase family protein [Pseudonocardia sp. KRD291]